METKGEKITRCVCYRCLIDGCSGAWEMLQNKSGTCVMSVTSMSFRSFYLCTRWQRLTGTARKRERKWYETVWAWIFPALHWEDKNGLDALKLNLTDATTETNLSSLWCRGRSWNVGDGKRSNPVRGKRNTSRSDRERLCWRRVFFPCLLNGLVFVAPERLVFCHGNHCSAKVHGNPTCKEVKLIIPAQLYPYPLPLESIVVCVAWVTSLHFLTGDKNW